MAPRFHMVDVFAERPLAGNPLAVVVSGKPLSDTVMQQLATEINFSETTFVSNTPDRDGAYPMRLFTPAREIAFAGHPILGTAWVVRRHVCAGEVTELSLRLSVGQIPVRFEQAEGDLEVAWFQAPSMTMGPVCRSDLMAAALGLSLDDLDTSRPVQMVSAGTSAMVVPLRSLAALERSRLDLQVYAPLTAQGFPPLVYLFCNETRQSDSDLSARFFFEAYGVREDPATGNGAAFLGAYLLKHGALRVPERTLRIEQGYMVNRPSVILLQANRVGGEAHVSVGGSVIQTVAGDLVCA